MNVTTDHEVLGDINEDVLAGAPSDASRRRSAVSTVC